jgi:NAD(P)-dependent dehydrogenase (short-subunit alcohol dehydrogenase family)
VKRLDGKTAVVTGGGSGIGLASAQRFVDEGAFVYIFGRRRDVIEDAVAKLGPHARGVVGSVTNLEDLDNLFAAVAGDGRRVDVLLANVGISELAPLGEITVEQYDSIFGTNVRGQLFTVQKALSLMSSGGSIILTGSTGATMGIPSFTLYGASKAALRSFARTWVRDLQGTGIRVNVLSQGATLTEKAAEIMGEADLEAVRSGTPLGRVDDPA